MTIMNPQNTTPSTTDVITDVTFQFYQKPARDGTVATADIPINHNTVDLFMGLVVSGLKVKPLHPESDEISVEMPAHEYGTSEGRFKAYHLKPASRKVADLEPLRDRVKNKWRTLPTNQRVARPQATRKPR